METAGELIDAGLVVLEHDEQSPIRRTLNA